MLGPIFQREFLTLPRRAGHYVTRAVYLGVLWILALTAWQAVIGWDRSATLGDNARFHLILFQVLTYVQLTLLLFFSALSAANSITLEKDRRTFVLLLMTDLRNYEIVLGKLFGSLLQILLLLSGTLPIFAILLFLGGIAGDQVIQAFLIMAATAIAAGSLGGVVALWREKTFQSLALTVLFIVLYLCLVRALILLPALTGPNSTVAVLGWQERLDPFLALQSVLEPFAEAHTIIPAAYSFTFCMLVLSGLLNALGIWRLRVWNPRGDPIIQRENVGDQPEVDRAKAHAAPGQARHVWSNPILFREIMTRAYGRRPLIVKLAYFVVLALIGYYALMPIVQGDEKVPWAAANGLVPITILSMLLVSAQSVTAITSERDIKTLDLLLVTDLTPNEFIFGKLAGILYNTKEFLIPPILLAIFYGVAGYLATPPEPVRNLESTFCVVVSLLILFAFVMVLGIHIALRTEISRLAIINALGTVFFLTVGTLICIYLILINGRFEYQWASFIFFLAAGIGGLWWVLSAGRSSTALTLAAWACPLAVFYSVTNILIGKPGTRETADPFLPFLVTAGAFGFTLAAMMIPLLSEFDVAMGRTTGEAD
jgi:ABC-type transport system involved in multi-copper enzyme maturation permease subunit